MVTRRSFVVASTLSLVAFRAAQLPALNPRPRRADHVLVIRGGTVFDGTGPTAAAAPTKSMPAALPSPRASSTSIRTATARSPPTPAPSR